MDLIDRIAEALPADIRADYYRELRHCRSLPENDEMLRILRVMQFLTLLMHDIPARVTKEREQLDSNLSGCIAALTRIESQLENLPEEVAGSISPEAVAGRINESLRQQFIQTTIPQTSDALARSAAEIKKSVMEFAAGAKEISNSYRGAAQEAREAVESIHYAIQSATKRSRDATQELSRTLLYLSRTSVVVGGLGLYLFGLMCGFLAFR
jgi:methyl-accepting chemotaxis protein